MTDGESYYPIRELSTYQSRWTIKARVVQKSEMSDLKQGQTKLFSIDLLDKDGGQIRAKFWRDAAVKFFPLVQQGKVYTFSRGKVDVANKRYNPLPHHYELAFGTDAQIEEAKEDANIEKQKFTFTKLRDIRSQTGIQTVDMVGIVKSYMPVKKVTVKRDNSELVARGITVVDDSECAIEVTLFAKHAEDFDDNMLGEQPTIVMKNVTVKDHNGGRNASTSKATTVHLNFDIPEAKKMKTWFKEKGNALSFSSLAGQGVGGLGGDPKKGTKTEEVTVEQMKAAVEALSPHDQGGYYAVTVRVGRMRAFGAKGDAAASQEGDAKEKQGAMYYLACPNCKKKVSEGSGDHYRCEACSKSVQPTPRYLFGATIHDHTESCVAYCFHENGHLITGMDCEALRAIEGQEEKLAAKLDKAQWGLYNIVLRGKQEEYNGVARARYTIIRAEPVKMDSYKNKFLADFKRNFGDSEADVKVEAATIKKENMEATPDPEMDRAAKKVRFTENPPAEEMEA